MPLGPGAGPAFLQPLQHPREGPGKLFQGKPGKLHLLGGQGEFLRQFGQYLPGFAFQLLHFPGGFLELFVFRQLPHQGFLRGKAFLVLHPGGLGQHGPAFDFHQRGGHLQKFAGAFHVQFVHAGHVRQVLFRNFGNENFLNVDAGLADEGQKQIQRPVELLERHGIRHATKSPRRRTQPPPPGPRRKGPSAAPNRR